jgi:opacity protein-like surface antigen
MRHKLNVCISPNAGQTRRNFMKKILVGALALALSASSAIAQSLDDLNIQIHGYATQGFLYTTQNNILTTSSSNGSPAWTEAVVNLTSQPDPKLRVGVQARYFMLGNYGNEISLDWAQADYKFSDKFGVRFGKVKSPTACGTNCRTSTRPISGRCFHRGSIPSAAATRFFPTTAGWHTEPTISAGAWVSSICAPLAVNA